MDCLRFLVRLTSDLGLKEAQDYALLLKKAEKTAENKRQVPIYPSIAATSPEILRNSLPQVFLYDIFSSIRIKLYGGNSE